MTASKMSEEIASAILSDPVAAAQIKEHIKPKQLLELLDLGPTVTEPAILALAADMQFKLDKNKHKNCVSLNPNGTGRSWSNCDTHWLLMRLRQEADELYLEMSRGDIAEARLECADIANFAMMIHDKLGNTI